MSLELALFLLLAAVAVVTALGLLLSRNAIYSALFLVLNFAAVATLYLLLHAPFLALAQITVYAGAIMVLFLFVIMLLGAERLRGPSSTGGLRWQFPLAVAAAIILVGEALYLIFARTPSILATTSLPAGFGGPEAIGGELFSDYLLPFEVTSILLLVAMIGAVVLSREEPKRDAEAIRWSPPPT